MATAGKERSRYGIAEWYGRRINDYTADELKALASMGSAKLSGLPCPFRQAAQPGATCNKKGGICTVQKRTLQGNGTVLHNGPLVTLCPSRFWEDNFIFEIVGTQILNVETPIVLKEVQFLTSAVGLDEIEEKEGEAVGRIDSILIDPADSSRWCALELQAVYFSGEGMGGHIKQYEDPSEHIFPDANRRPDYRSSGPKRLMPQLQTKIPTLRRWGKKMSVVIDTPFRSSLGSFVTVKHLSNCDIVWFVVEYDETTGKLKLADTIATTLESSIEALTAAIPLSQEAFQGQIDNFLLEKTAQARKKVLRLGKSAIGQDMTVEHSEELS
ncbi:NotI family restriction endonuclease [Blastomonas sp. SL216]|uniref:NotI family restriction endonuclease n=1 Tax=Blastomonas sp. SL216 TaxID=2995169 RepID=UPI0023777586|nr:NotI family restriction endonuclease [Blastomonas sp. SL216]